MKEVAKAINTASYIIAFISIGAIYGIVLIWDEIKTLTDYDTFIWQINGELTFYFSTLGASIFIFIATAIFLRSKARSNRSGA